MWGHIPTLRKTVSVAQTIYIPDFDMEGDRPATKGAYTAWVNKQGPDSACAYCLDDLVKLGFRHISWDGQ